MKASIIEGKIDSCRQSSPTPKVHYRYCAFACPSDLLLIFVVLAMKVPLQ